MTTICYIGQSGRTSMYQNSTTGPVMFNSGTEDVVQIGEDIRFNKPLSMAATGPSSIPDAPTGYISLYINADDDNTLYYQGSKTGPVSGFTGPASSLDKEIVTFSGTDASALVGAGVRNYGAQSSDPTTPTPQAGDTYYNTTINHLMCYDGTRSKWLSVTTLMDGGGRNGTTAANTYYRRWNGMVTSASLGPFVAKGTVVGIGYSTSTAVTHTYQVILNGSVITTLASGGAASAYSDTINADFASGILASRNATGSATTTNLQSVIYYKLRA